MTYRNVINLYITQKEQEVINDLYKTLMDLPLDLDISEHEICMIIDSIANKRKSVDELEDYGWEADIGYVED